MITLAGRTRNKNENRSKHRLQERQGTCASNGTVGEVVPNQ